MGDVDALHEHFSLDWTLEIETFANGSGGGQHLICRKAEPDPRIFPITHVIPQWFTPLRLESERTS
jgi:hypothetical protein